jgi:hypothetical protein
LAGKIIWAERLLGLFAQHVFGDGVFGEKGAGFLSSFEDTGILAEIRQVRVNGYAWEMLSFL